MTGWIKVGVMTNSIMALPFQRSEEIFFRKRKPALNPRGSPAFAEEPLVAPVCDEAGVVVCPRALPHLAHLLGKRLRPGEPAREVAARARLEEQAVAARLDQAGQRAQAARDDRQRVGVSLDQRPGKPFVAQARKHEARRAA